MSYRQTTVSGFPAIALRGEELELVAVPTLGMKLTHLRRARGREWLWRNPQLPLALPRPGASYVATADSGGWDECFPTVGPSPVPGAPAGGAPLPDHGELWSADWESSVYSHASGTTLSARCRGTRLPYEFQRDVTVDLSRPMVRLRYRVTNTGEDPFPWIWSSHPLFNVQPGSILDLGGVRQAKVDAAHGLPSLAHGASTTWPLDGTPGGPFVFPEPRRYAAKLFVDAPPSGAVSLTDARRGERIELRFDPALIPHVGVWINLEGWAPEGFAPYYNLALEPCIGAPDRLADAADWGTIPVLAPAESREWWLEVWIFDPEDDPAA